ncbi:peroxide stress protein YaaA [Anaerocolumna sp.]|uniref:peroxide stress protein YaaA n=1 Tax=Anaerocolumna sp. TaxID=2041569 RepID=UPI0028ABC307|nr:peroxide stress protein YaaA [Anaerocolumna sp.]
MKVIISPAKNMRVVTRENRILTDPQYINKTKQLASILKEYPPFELESLMHVNSKLAMETFVDLQNWTVNKQDTPALLAYHGLQYKNIDPDTFTKEDFEFAGETIRILSGLYGMLKATDKVCPYRLEMQCKLDINGKNLYGFWNGLLYEELFQNQEIVINLASKEYSSVIEPYLLPFDRMITCDFKIMKGGKLRTLATEAKMARGQMVRYIIKNRITKPEKLKGFSWNDYYFETLESRENRYTFIKN